MANSLPSDYDVTVLQITQLGERVPVQPPGRFHEVLSAERGRSYTPQNVIRGLIGPTPITVLNYTSEKVAVVIEQTLQSDRFDVVQMESIHLFRYLANIRKVKNPPAVVLDWHNIESELMQRFAEGTTNRAKKLIALRTAQLLEKLEDRALTRFSAHTVVSEREREKLLLRNSKAQIHVVPNGVDTAAFESKGISEATSRHTLLFVGSMDYHANSDAVIWFCRDVWPQLATQFPEMDFKIVGRNPPASVQALASSRVLVTGTVEDVCPFYQQAFAVVVPLRVGGGTRLKILEAMAAGVPVIATRLGAEGIAAEDNIEILIADTPNDMQAAIQGLRDKPNLVARLRENGRRLVCERYDWKVLGQKLADVYTAQQK